MYAREFHGNTGRMRRDLDRDKEVVLDANVHVSGMMTKGGV